jgi:PAS domain S-box-containing protein
MNEASETPAPVETLLSTPDLVEALESEHFRRFLDHIPVALLVATLGEGERVVYANPEAARVTGLAVETLEAAGWAALVGEPEGEAEGPPLAEAIIAGSDHVGTFRISREGGEPTVVEAYSNRIEDDAGVPVFRLVALVDVSRHLAAEREEFARLLADRDVLLREMQHRVKNNLQMVTALIRIEARSAAAGADGPLDRLAGRIEAVQLLHQALAAESGDGIVDLGIYLSQVAAMVMRAHASEGIRLDLKVDAWPVSVNVAMPTGLVVNELLTNALKHAFPDGGGTITLHALVEDGACRVVVADDGVGLPAGCEWPQAGRLGALIVQSLRQNARASLSVDSASGRGTRVTIRFDRDAAAA